MANVVDQLDAALASCRIFNYPFPVRYFRPFSNDLYHQIISNMPKDESYLHMQHPDALREDGTSTRLVLSLRNERIDALPVRIRWFWRELANDLRSKSLEDVFRKHLDIRVPIFPDPLLLRDFDGYKISPHPDSPSKIITAQFYLPQDETQSQLGTSFYNKLNNGTLELALTLEYMPNTGYCFVVSENSWHGTVFGGFGNPRNSLILNYYKHPVEKY